jgi:hypothetical protein
MSLYGISDRTRIAGTATFTNGSKTVTGSGTSFTSELRTGVDLIIEDRDYTVATVASATSLTLTKEFDSTEVGFGFRLEDGTLDDADTDTSITESALGGGSLLLDGVADDSGNSTGEGDKVLNETQTSSASVAIIKKEFNGTNVGISSDDVIGVDVSEMRESSDNIVNIFFGANTNSGGSGGSGYSSAPTITVGAPATFTFDPAADGDNDGDVSTSANTISFEDHGFEGGEAIKYADGGGTTIQGLTENNMYYVNVSDEDTIQLSANYGGILTEDSYGEIKSSIALEDETDTTSGSGAGDILFQEGGGTAANSGMVNLTGVGAGTSHTLVGVTATATASFEETAIRLEDGATDDNSGEFLLLDGIDSASRGIGEKIIMAGGPVTGSIQDFAVGHLGFTQIALFGSNYGIAPAVTVAAPSAKTFNAASAVDGANITIANHGFCKDDAVTYSENSGTAIAELTDGGTLFIVSVDGDVIQVSATKGGSAISMTDGSSENHTLTGETAVATATVGPGSNRGSGVAHTGWNKQSVGTGGRAGRIHYETLVAGHIVGSGSSVGNIS